MNASTRNAAMFANPLLLWSTFGLKMLQMSTAAAQVIAMRTTRMAAHGANPDAADRREMHRMGAEKVDAFTRAGAALAAGVTPATMKLGVRAGREAYLAGRMPKRFAASPSSPMAGRLA